MSTKQTNDLHQHLLDMLGAKDHVDAGRIIAELHAAQAHPSRGVVDADDLFEQYVATLIAKNPDVRKLGERLADWLDEDRFNTINPILLGIAQRLSAQPAVPPVPEDGWQPIETIPRDESRVELLSANGKTDNGRWCNRPDWVGHTDDIQDYLDTDNGEGSYTHWRPLAATPKDQPAALNMEHVRNEAFNLADTVIEHIESGNVQAARDAIRESLAALAASATPAGPETWQDRLRIEHAELDARFTKLCAFLESDKFASLHEDDRRILMAQANGMRVYLNALTFRVDQLDYAIPTKGQPAQGVG